jgi:hypothetical protein
VLPTYPADDDVAATALRHHVAGAGGDLAARHAVYAAWVLGSGAVSLVARQAVRALVDTAQAPLDQLVAVQQEDVANEAAGQRQVVQRVEVQHRSQGDSEAAGMSVHQRHTQWEAAVPLRRQRRGSRITAQGGRQSVEVGVRPGRAGLVGGEADRGRGVEEMGSIVGRVEK